MARSLCIILRFRSLNHKILNIFIVSHCIIIVDQKPTKPAYYIQGIQRNKASNLVCVCLVNNDRLQIFLFEESTEKDVGVDSKRGGHRLEKVRGFFDQSGESSKPKLLSNLPIMTVTDP